MNNIDIYVGWELSAAGKKEALVAEYDLSGDKHRHVIPVNNRPLEAMVKLGEYFTGQDVSCTLIPLQKMVKLDIAEAGCLLSAMPEYKRMQDFLERIQMSG